MNNFRYRWYAPGDVNAFFGLMLDNIAGLILVVSLLQAVFSVPSQFTITHMVPGTAIGVLVGDLIYFFMALWLARKTQRSDVTAMPLGLDTPSTFGMVFLVLGPAFIHAKNNLGLDELSACQYMWHIGICCIFLTGLFKVVCSLFSNWARNLFPRAGLLGSLASIALVLISFLPLLDVVRMPIVGMIALTIVLTSLIGKVPLPFKLPGSVGALIVAVAIFGVMNLFNLNRADIEPAAVEVILLPTDWLSVFSFAWLEQLNDSLGYLPIILPFALGTVIGGIDCTESASSAGDDYPTGAIIGVEALATLSASLCGGVIQNTPYIGHPAYKAMGGRAAYALATALFIGAAGTIGFFGVIYQIVPKAAVFPILVFVGLEITGQSFLATPKRHFPAIALACVPALAYLSLTFTNQVFTDPNIQIASAPPVIEQLHENETQNEKTSDQIEKPNSEDKSDNETTPKSTEEMNQAELPANSPNWMQLANPELRLSIQTASLLANGFILVSLLWSSALAMAIDRRLDKAAWLFVAAAVLTLFGIIHSPLSNNAIFFPFETEFISSSLTLAPVFLPLTARIAIAYLATAGVLFAWSKYLKSTGLHGRIDDHSSESH